ncbi:hypothetical protein ABQJ54_02085 [Rhodanobacter sp. Si-c]|uniref:DNA transfer protein p32 n=1 Tax=Rhodanobacter lycopersici TaxID=3162487 RepID=A0ABV3Q9W6_9GAMM
MAEIWGVAAAAGGAILGGVISSNGAQDPAQTQANAANNATQAELEMYNQNVQRLSPWTGAGQISLGNLMSLLGSNGANGLLTTPFSAAQYQESPGYQFQMQQGTQAIMNNAGALGGLNSGNTLKALQTYGQGLANQDYYQAANQYSNWQNQVYNMLSGASNTGANAAGQTAGLGASTANQIGSNMMSAGNSISAGQVASANAMGNSLSSLGNLAMYGQMNGMFGGSGGSDPWNLGDGSGAVMYGSGGLGMNMPSY